MPASWSQASGVFNYAKVIKFTKFGSAKAIPVVVSLGRNVIFLKINPLCFVSHMGNGISIAKMSAVKFQACNIKGSSWACVSK